MYSIPDSPVTSPDRPGDVPTDPNLATYPMCHAGHPSLTRAAVASGDRWRCVRCAQMWDAKRLSAVAAYATWIVERAQFAAAKVHVRAPPR